MKKVLVENEDQDVFSNDLFENDSFISNEKIEKIKESESTRRLKELTANGFKIRKFNSFAVWARYLLRCFSSL